MSTTEVLFEHLLGGIQAFIWVSLIILSTLGIEWIDYENIKNYYFAYSFVGLAFVYPLGVFMDNLSDKLLSRCENKIKIKHAIDANQHIGNLLEHGSKSLNDYFSYTRIRIRVSRVTFVNFILILISLIIFTFNIDPSSLNLSQFKLIFIEIIIGLFISSFAFYSWISIVNSYYKRAQREFKKNA